MSSRRARTRTAPPQSTPRPPRPTARGATAAGAAAAGAAAKPPVPKFFTFKAKVWTGAFAAVTFVGTIYGAGLKTQREYKAERQQIIEATPEQRIAALEDRKAALLLQRRPYDDKIARAKERIAEAARKKKAEEEAEGAARAAQGR